MFNALYTVAQLINSKFITPYKKYCDLMNEMFHIN